MTTPRLKFAGVLLVLLFASIAIAQQDPAPFNYALPGIETTIERIGVLEARRDPKCHATASRLEDFMYGTPLSDEARFAKIDLQKRLIRAVWAAADSRARETGRSEIDASTLEAITTRALVRRSDALGDWWVQTASYGKVGIQARDLRQYGAVAYAFRAILAVQQEQLFVEGQSFLSLDSEATEALKTFLDLYTLTALQLADRLARAANEHTLSAERLTEAWLGIHDGEAPATQAVLSPVETPGDAYALTRAVVAQKSASYEAYNDIALPVFLRNIQVYFARHEWPTGEAESTALKALFTEILIDYAEVLLEGAEAEAESNAHSLIRIGDVQTFAQSFLPHTLNNFEDATFFPALPRDERIVIESYDMDAFRDSGLHWQYIQAAIDEPGFDGRRAPDPFALELIAENIAQFGVLVLRVAGEAAAQADANFLAREHFERALEQIQQRIAKHASAGPAQRASEALQSADSADAPERDTPFFSDITRATGIAYHHRSADWLNRLIRGFLIRGGDTAVLAVPPAFGGSGVAVEDVNDDGHADVLLLGGAGPRLYLNRGAGTFRDATDESGLSWTGPDNLPGETRQPLFADFDNDGHQDLFISYVNAPHRLYRGHGDGSFTDLTHRAGLGGPGLVGGPAVTMDFDNDGLLDLYITYFGNYLEGILPTLARRNTNGTPNRLFRNRGDWTFEDVTEGAGVSGAGWTQAAGHTDFNRDGHQDLIEGNDFGTNAYYVNNGDGTFTDRAGEWGTDKPSYTMSVGIGDLNGDRHPDIYISNIVTMDKDQKYVNPDQQTTMKFDPETLAEMRVVEANDLFLSRMRAHTLDGYDLSMNVGRGRSATGWAWGADFFDADNDGDDDLYVANGMNEFSVYSSKNPYYRDPDGHARDVEFPESTREPNVFFLNEDGMLQHRAEQSGADLFGNSRAVAYADLDGDGDLDMVLNNYHEPAVVYRNNAESNGHRWLTVRLEGDPARGASRDAIGAILEFQLPGGYTVWREIHGGSGYLTSNPKEQHIGLGMAESADLTVYWPGGQVTRHPGLRAAERHRIAQSGSPVVPQSPGH